LCIGKRAPYFLERLEFKVINQPPFIYPKRLAKEKNHADTPKQHI
jgi:hypothetical protein